MFKGIDAKENKKPEESNEQEAANYSLAKITYVISRMSGSQTARATTKILSLSACLGVTEFSDVSNLWVYRAGPINDVLVSL